MLGFSSFRTQLLFLIIGLFSLVLTSVFFAVNQANQSNARSSIEETLGITSFTFQRDLASRNDVLIEKARLLSADFAFKEAVATNDLETILSALENHRARVRASVMMLATLDGDLIASTLPQNQKEQAWPLQSLQETAESGNSGEANGIQLLNGKPYQLVIMPLFTPEPSAWIVIGFRIRGSFSRRLAEQTHSQVSLLYQHKLKDEHQSTWQILSSTLSVSGQEDLLNHQNKIITSTESPVLDKVEDILLNGNEYLSLTLDIQGAGEGKTVAILQRSLNKALKPYRRLRTIMLTLFSLGLLFAAISIFYIARSLSKPLESLTKAVLRIDKGDYKQTDVSDRKDEIGTLSTAVNHMSKGLQERDQVRTLLGKVVSPEIATELLKKDIDLGGEDRIATILFSDIRQFTNFCEERDPKHILRLLNRYLSSMTDAIEAHQGVIDKYIGDAIMALFGVPVDIDNAPEQAVNAALAMMQDLEALNSELVKEDLPKLKIGIGINTGHVVAGNMGSSHRLNYTVIGDCVNCGSRLEGLTKYFGVSIIVSESTVKSCDNILFRELGSVQVKGKESSIRIYEPLVSNSLSTAQTKLLEQHHRGLEYFKQRKWNKAQTIFEELLQVSSQSKEIDDHLIYQLYLDNIKTLSKQKLSSHWSGELIFEEK